jgi:hypothetical protein
MAAGIVAFCATCLLYSLHKFTTGEAAGYGGPNASERSWVEAHVPAGTQVAAVGIGLGGTGAYGPIWESVEYWNSSVMNGVAFSPYTMPTALPFGGHYILLTPAGPSGLLVAHANPPYVTKVPVPRYLLVPSQATNPYAFEGTVLQTNAATPLELVKLKQPARLAWSVAGTSTEGFLTSGQPATATVYGNTLAATSGQPCASFSLQAPVGAAGPWHGHWPYTITSGGPPARSHDCARAAGLRRERGRHRAA